MHRRFFSQVIYGTLLRMYPHEFRARFASDLEADFADLLQARGTMATWLRILPDLCRSVPVTHARARAARKRRRATAYHGETAMSSLKADVRHAVRALVKAPVFTAVTVVTLALGIGATSAIFSLVNAVLLRPLGYVEPERLMLIYEGFRGSAFAKVGVSPPDFVDLTTLQRPFSSIGAYRTQQYELSGAGEPEQITGVCVSASVFPILGVRAAHGRTFLESEDQPGQDVAVLSYGLWQRRFGRDPNAVGRTMTLDRRPYTIVGIMPASFQFPKRGPQINGEPAQVWIPLALSPFERSQQARGMMYHHTPHWPVARRSCRRAGDAGSRRARAQPGQELPAHSPGPDELAHGHRRAAHPRDCRAGPETIADSARRGRTRAAGRVRERRESRAQSSGDAPAWRSACAPRSAPAVVVYCRCCS